MKKLFIFKGKIVAAEKLPAGRMKVRLSRSYEKISPDIWKRVHYCPSSRVRWFYEREVPV